MKAGNIGNLKNKLKEIPQRLKKFVTHDVRRNPILGLYLVIGVMVVGYAIYFVAVLYLDFTSEPEKRIASKPETEQTKKAPPKPSPPPPKKSAPAPTKKPPKQMASTQGKTATKKGAEKPKSASAKKLEIAKWQEFEFKDGSRISFPPDWNRSEIPSDKNVLHGIRLQAPSAEASLKCYGRSKRSGADIATSLKKTMRKGGYIKIKEETKEVDNLDVVQLSGKLADKHMVVSIFDDQAGKDFIISLVASEQDYKTLLPYYGAVVDSYRGAKSSAVSISRIEEELEKSIEAEKEEYLVGTAIRIKLKSGARHQGVVIAENDDSIKLESYRFGGRYSFTVKKEDIVEIVR
jgi:hypothetical protein